MKRHRHNVFSITDPHRSSPSAIMMLEFFINSISLALVELNVQALSIPQQYHATCSRVSCGIFVEEGDKRKYA